MNQKGKEEVNKILKKKKKKNMERVIGIIVKSNINSQK